MPFPKLTRAKRQQLLLVGLLTLGAMGSLGGLLIRHQYAQLHATATATAAATAQLGRMKTTLQRAEDIARQRTAAAATLAGQEADMATGDLYAWGLDLLQRFRAAYPVEVPTIAQPVPGACNLLPQFPYQQATFTLGGRAYYHDLGRFLADFENQFPHCRVVNLNLDPAASLLPAEKEKLEFKLDLVVLVRPNQN